MSWKTGVALLVLAAGLGGFYVYDTYWLVPAREKAESVKGRLWEVDPKDVEGMTLARKGEAAVKLKRAGDGWEMLEPVKARADRGAVDGVLTTVVTARVDREIDPSPTKLADYGLEPPEAEISLEVKGRKEPLVLRLGAKSPTGAWVYGREATKPALLALSEIVSRDAAKPVAELRDKTVLAFARKSVSGFDLEVAGDAISVEAQDGSKWRITRPAPYAGDGDVVNEFLDKLETAKVKEFVGAAGTPAQYGLDRPSKVTIWQGKDKDRASRALLIGKVDAEKKAVYVMRPGESEVLLAPEELWTAVPKTVAALRDKIVLAYAYDKVKRVEVESPKGTVALERDGGGWKLVSPEPLKADSGAVNGLLWRIRDLRSIGFIADDPAGVARYLGKPEVTVRVVEEGAKEPKTLLLASSKETRGGQPAAVAAVAGQASVALVDGKALAGPGQDVRRPSRQVAVPGVRADRRQARPARLRGQAGRGRAQGRLRVEARRAQESREGRHQGRQGHRPPADPQGPPVEGHRVRQGRRRRAVRAGQAAGRGRAAQGRRLGGGHAPDRARRGRGDVRAAQERARDLLRRRQAPHRPAEGPGGHRRLAAGGRTRQPRAFVRITVGPGGRGGGTPWTPVLATRDPRHSCTEISRAETSIPEAWVQGVPPPHPPGRARIPECDAGVLPAS